MTDRVLLQRVHELRDSMPETPMTYLPCSDIRLYSKLEYSNPSGSSKDRSAYWILKCAIERGQITSHSTVVESSSGNFAIALSTLCASLGIKFVPVIDPNINASTEAYLRSVCETVCKVTEPDHTGGYLGTRLATVERLRSEIHSVYWPNQYANTDALFAHYRLTGGELCHALSSIDYLFIGTSTGGTISGLSLRAKEMHPNVTIVAVDSEGSVIFDDRPRKRLLPGLGASIRPPLCGRALIDDVVLVPEREAVWGCNELLSTYGLYTGGSTGSVYAAIRTYFATRARTSERIPTVAFLSTDRGFAYADTIYNPLWVAEMLSDDHQLSATQAPRPDERAVHA